jgi:hypothetical protein
VRERRRGKLPGRVRWPLRGDADDGPGSPGNGKVADDVDPAIAERVILAVFSDDSLDDIDARKSFQTQLLLMVAIVSGENLDDGGLDAFLAEARKLADEWLA